MTCFTEAEEKCLTPQVGDRVRSTVHPHKVGTIEVINHDALFFAYWIRWDDEDRAMAGYKRDCFTIIGR